MSGSRPAGTVVAITFFLGVASFALVPTPFGLAVLLMLARPARRGHNTAGKSV